MTKKLYEVSGFTTHGEWFVAFGVFSDIDSITGYFRLLNMSPQNILKLRQVHKDTKEGVIDVRRFDSEQLLNLLY